MNSDVDAKERIYSEADGGWATAGVGQKYGSGYGLEVKARWIRAIVSNQ